jgi:hypothetical protein
VQPWKTGPQPRTAPRGASFINWLTFEREIRSTGPRASWDSMRGLRGATVYCRTVLVMKWGARDCRAHWSVSHAEENQKWDRTHTGTSFSLFLCTSHQHDPKIGSGQASNVRFVSDVISDPTPSQKPTSRLSRLSSVHPSCHSFTAYSSTSSCSIKNHRGLA